MFQLGDRPIGTGRVRGAPAPLSPADRSLVSSILEAAHAKAVKAQGEGRLPQMVKSFLKPLWERRSYRTRVGELVVIPADSGPPSFHAWLSAHPRADRARDLKKSRRIVNGLKKWPLSWLKKTGVVCYERADGRIRRERSGRADGAFLRGGGQDRGAADCHGQRVRPLCGALSQ